MSLYLCLLHLLERHGPLLDVPSDLDELDAAEAADAEGGDDAQVGELQVLVLLVDAAKKGLID